MLYGNSSNANRLAGFAKKNYFFIKVVKHKVCPLMKALTANI